MCGQCGIILGQKRRTHAELNHLKIIFTSMLLDNAKRGRDATGILTAEKKGFCQTCKEPVAADELIKLHRFKKLMNSVSNKTSCLMGHTRWKTVGSSLNPKNNHPVVSHHFIGTHNGTIKNHDWLFKAYGWKRKGEVDTEAMLRLADSCLSGWKLNFLDFTDGLKDFTGTMSFIILNLHDTQNIYICKGNMPLSLAYNRKYRCIVYSSEETSIARAINKEQGWKLLDLPYMTIIRININNILDWERHNVCF